MRRIVLGPFNRVEGDLEISLDVDAGQVFAARVNSPLFRGFEQILTGRAASVRWPSRPLPPRRWPIYALSKRP